MEIGLSIIEVTWTRTTLFEEFERYVFFADLWSIIFVETICMMIDFSFRMKINNILLFFSLFVLFVICSLFSWISISFSALVVSEGKL
jgi:hypothetical protein